MPVATFRLVAVEAAERHALELGARRPDTDDDGGRRGLRVYADPAGIRSASSTGRERRRRRRRPVGRARYNGLLRIPHGR